MSRFTIREMQLSDTPQVADISMRSWQSAYRGIMPDSVLDNIDVKKREDNWASGFTNLPELIRTVAVDDANKVLGYTAGAACRDIKSKENGELWAIYVDPKLTGKGIGKELMQDFKQRLLTQGFKHMFVWTLADNQSAIYFYTQNGGVLYPKTKDFKVEKVSLKEVCYKFDL